MTAGKPVWTTSSFLLYAGGLTVLGAAIAAMGYLAPRYGDATMAGWTLLILGALYAVAHWFRRRDRWIAAGIFAFASVIAWGAFLRSCWIWAGWLHAHSSPAFQGFSFARLSVAFLILVAAADDRRRFRFPFISAISAVVGWYFVTDLISNGGGWTAVVTLIIGLAYLLAGTVSDNPSAFWLHFVGGALVGGSLVYWWHTSDAQWAGISVAALVYVLLAYATKRSSWAVLATIGFFGATVHYVVGAPQELVEHPVARWAPSVAFACLGFWIVLLGLLGRRRPA